MYVNFFMTVLRIFELFKTHKVEILWEGHNFDVYYIVKSKVEILSIFVAYLEYPNFKSKIRVIYQYARVLMKINIE